MAQDEALTHPFVVRARFVEAYVSLGRVGLCGRRKKKVEEKGRIKR